MDSGQLVERHHRLDPRPESARLARQAVLDALTEADRRDLVDTATLLVTELVTNAIVHAHTRIDLAILAGADGLRVAVHDGSPNRPTPRHYGATATTGRGLELVELLSDRHGTDSDKTDGSRDSGKTVWFELGPGPGSATEDEERGRENGVDTELTVHLNGLPVRLCLAWQQHADTLLRELMLSRWDDSGPVDEVLPGDEVAAGDAFTAVAAELEALGSMADLPPYVDVTLPLRHGRAAHFAELDRLLDHVAALAERGQTLAPPTQPEIRGLRRWICGQVRDQAAGQPPQAWPGVPPESPAPARAPIHWDPTTVDNATEAVIAGDDTNLIVAASPAAMRLLGWDGDLVGQRLVAIIPERLREAHIASFTMHVLTGEKRIVDREVVVDALRRDGSEVPVRLLVRRESIPGGRIVFTATLAPV